MSVNTHVQVRSVEAVPSILKGVTCATQMWRYILEECVDTQSLSDNVSRLDTDFVGKTVIALKIDPLSNPWNEDEKFKVIQTLLLTDTNVPDCFRRTDLLFYVKDPSGRHCVRAVYVKDCIVVEMSPTQITLSGEGIAGPFPIFIAQGILNKDLPSDTETCGPVTIPVEDLLANT